MTKEIPLTRGYVALVDDADYDWLSQWKWVANGTSSHVYATRQEGHAHDRHIILMHRLITDASAGLEVHHVNRNSLDNRRANLQIVTRKEHMVLEPRGRGKHPGATGNHRQRPDVHIGASGFRYVTRDYDKRYPNMRKVWRVIITVNGKRIQAGGFASIEEAVAARNDVLASLGAEL